MSSDTGGFMKGPSGRILKEMLLRKMARQKAGARATREAAAKNTAPEKESGAPIPQSETPHTPSAEEWETVDCPDCQDGIIHTGTGTRIGEHPCGTCGGTGKTSTIRDD